MSQSLSSRDRLDTIARRAMIQRGLEPEFPPQALTQLSSIRGPAEERDPAILDLRQLLWCSIDNDDSRDLDQLSVAEEKSGGKVLVRIAVADVDALVKAGSPIDKHAGINTTSVYTAAGIFPMLPERLSTDLTSLGQDDDRLAIVVDFTVDQNGKVVDSAVHRAHVRNRAKLAYDATAAWLDGKAPIPAAIARVPGLEANLRVQDRVAQTMKELRHEEGALTLETLEARPVFDGGNLIDLRTDSKNRAKELIENFMIAANGVTARYLENERVPFLRRVLKTPEKWNRIVALAQEVGAHLPSSPDARALEEVLCRVRKERPAQFPDFSLSVVKLLGRGEYAMQGPGEDISGHFGLAVRDYTHSTAPNRRYPDLITQRALKAALAGARPPYDRGQMMDLAQQCTRQEDAATKVERQVAKSAAALLLVNRIHDRFDGIVTGAGDKGTWARIAHPVVEGKVVRGFEDLDVGDKVKLELVHTDVERGFIDFVRV
jgi:VacB/RNase II family 3'-5' exoribonuclease